MARIFNSRTKHYTFPEILRQIKEVESVYNDTKYEFRGKHGVYNVYVLLKPTEDSITYRIKLSATIGSKTVKVYPVKPHIGARVDGKKVPHMFHNGSLCLFYPKYSEWKYSDSWAKTLIPWTCVWLYYYEIWLTTGEWLGGGIHGSTDKVQKE